jgi:hypothetical protein
MQDPVSFTIPARFNGPPGTGNGGYACGQIAALIGEQVRIRLQRPVPLDTELFVVEMADPHGVSWQVRQDGQGVALARPTKVVLEAPAPPSYVEALAASKHYAGFEGHLFPTCFVCGPDRTRGDGLRIFAASLPGTDRVAAPWMPDLTLAGPDGKVRPEFIWAALDCPGYFAAVPLGLPAVLGEFTVHVDRLVHVDEPCVIVGWKLGVDGRKYRVGTALFDEDGELCAVGEATWVALASPE